MSVRKVSDHVLAAVRNAISSGHHGCGKIMRYTALSRSSVKRALAIIKGCPTDTSVPGTPVSRGPNGVSQGHPLARVVPTLPLSTKQERKTTSLTEDHRVVVEAWNAMAKGAGLAQVTVVSGRRRDKLALGLRDHGTDGVLEAIREVGLSGFCRGKNEREWKADFDWLVERGMAKAREGKYRDRASPVDTRRQQPVWRTEGAYVKPEVEEIVT